MTSIAWLIVWLPLAGFLFCAGAGRLFPDRKAAKQAVAWVAPGVVLAAFAVSLYVLVTVVLPAPDHRAYAALLPGLSPQTPWIAFASFRVNFGLLLDPLSMLMALIVTGVGGLIHVYATGYMAKDYEQPRFFTYFNLFIVMMLLLVMAENFLLMFVGWEGVGTCSYLLISFWFNDNANARAGNKAFIVNRVGDLGFALGMMAIWSVFGTLSFFLPNGHGVMQLAAQHVDGAGHPLAASADLMGRPILTAICVLLFVGACGKSAQIPLWVWLPDAMAGPTPVSALIHAATMVTAGVVMVSRCSWLFVQAAGAMRLVGWIGLATALMAATIALVQNDIKKVLAYSTISQLGYMFLACGVGNFVGGMFHVTTHAFFKALLFLGSGAVIHAMHGEQDMRRMGGLRKLIPRTWTVMFVGTYAIAGFPLLSGFWSKDDILHAAAGSAWGSGMILYLVGLGTALLTAFYMNRLMWKTFYVNPQFEDGHIPEHVHGVYSDEEAARVETGQPAMLHADAGDGHGGDHGAEHAGHGSVHEAPPSMMIPLYILAAFSVAFGAIVGPTHIFERFLEPSIAPLSLGRLRAHADFLEEAAHSPYAGYVLSGLIAIAGLALAASIYRKHMANGLAMSDEAKRRNPLYALFANLWLFDRVYDAVFIRFGGQVGAAMADTFDAQLIDGSVNGAAGAIGRLSAAARRLQTGYVRNYAIAMLFGAVLIIAALLFART